MLTYNRKNVVLGVDEVGRGALAGPVIATAVILPENIDNIIIKDSKKIPVKKIASVATEIKKIAVYAIGMVSVKEIEELNVLRATMLAMRRAVLKITHRYDAIRVDGNQNPFKDHTDLEKTVETLIGGDAFCRSIAAASIIAKNYRDTLMQKLHQQYPKYYWNDNKGYGTKKHFEAIDKYGISKHHRTLFCRKFWTGS